MAELLPEVTKDDFEAKVLEASTTVVVCFWASWAGPCRMMDYALLEVSHRDPEVPFLRLDIDKCRDLTSQYRVLHVPTLLVFSGGEVVETVVGARGARELYELLKPWTQRP